ncbi:type II toxin-antitoxin system prevent-host-death family antitoxin [Verrucosispora sp. WMMC514]|uniref:type II toxin-antitoxin system Phd/YefM family antitoxin n=1 Tax=Verrucosispora sp. WMMC514 TaxID=3015156 RepID=UPI00248D1E4F|nr:type II toxin-antitoxin system prevent-host-death family antitoxin [Verrucosispora sp. WMMC514]WBB94235.1 type II toxin-antitoxin system prevent-host-death family antitoxin [Verrucosispora sp. WMMC514]
MAKRPIIGAQQAREKFSDLLKAVERGEHPVLLRRSTPVGLFVPAAWYKQAAELMGDPWDDWTPPAKPDADAS